jgi:hypothetical protein
MKMNRKTICLIAALLLWGGVLTAAPFWFSQKAGAGSEAALADDLIFNNGQVITNLNAAGSEKGNAAEAKEKQDKPNTSVIES